MPIGALSKATRNRSGRRRRPPRPLGGPSCRGRCRPSRSARPARRGAGRVALDPATEPSGRMKRYSRNRVLPARRCLRPDLERALADRRGGAPGASRRQARASGSSPVSSHQRSFTYSYSPVARRRRCRPGGCAVRARKRLGGGERFDARSERERRGGGRAWPVLISRRWRERRWGRASCARPPSRGPRVRLRARGREPPRAPSTQRASKAVPASARRSAIASSCVHAAR